MFKVTGFAIDCNRVLFSNKEVNRVDPAFVMVGKDLKLFSPSNDLS